MTDLRPEARQLLEQEDAGRVRIRGDKLVETNPANKIDACRYPGLPCDRICTECAGMWDD